MLTVNSSVNNIESSTINEEEHNLLLEPAFDNDLSHIKTRLGHNKRTPLKISGSLLKSTFLPLFLKVIICICTYFLYENYSKRIDFPREIFINEENVGEIYNRFVVQIGQNEPTQIIDLFYYMILAIIFTLVLLPGIYPEAITGVIVVLYIKLTVNYLKRVELLKFINKHKWKVIFYLLFWEIYSFFLGYGEFG